MTPTVILFVEPAAGAAIGAMSPARQNAVDTEAAEGEETTTGGTPAAAEPESTTAAVVYSAPVEMTEAEKLKAMPDVTA